MKPPLIFTAPLAIGILVIFAVALAPSFALAAPPASPYLPGETLNPTCAPTDPNCTVTPPLSATTTLTTGSVPFIGNASGTVYENNANFFWDNAADTLTVQNLKIPGIGGLTYQCLHVDASGTVSGSGADCGTGGSGITHLGTSTAFNAFTASVNGVNATITIPSNLGFFTNDVGFITSTPASVASVASGTDISVSNATGSVTINFINPGFASSSILVNGGGILSGGGDLTANRTISLSTSTLNVNVAALGYVTSTGLAFYNVTSANGFISVATTTNSALLTFSSSSLNLGTAAQHAFTDFLASSTASTFYLASNPSGFVTAASSVTWIGAQTFNNISTFNATTTLAANLVLASTTCGVGQVLSTNAFGVVQCVIDQTGSGVGSTTINGITSSTFNFLAGGILSVASSANPNNITYSLATSTLNTNIAALGYVTSTGLAFYNVISANPFIAVSTTTNSALLTFSSSSLNLGTAAQYAFTDFLASSTSFVSSFNGGTGSVTGVGSISSGTFISASAATGSVTLNFINPGFVTAASSVNWTALQTFTGGTAFNSTATFNSSTIFSVATSTLAFLNSSGQLGSSAIGTGLALIGNTLSNTGVTAAASGTGISVSNATGTVTFTNTGVTSFNGGTGSVTGVGSISSGNFISASAATGSVTINFINPGFVTAASSVTWSAGQTFTLGATFNGGLTTNATATFNSSTIISTLSNQIPYATSTGLIGGLSIGANLSLVNGTLSATAASTTLGGASTDIQFNNGSTLGGSPLFTFTSSTGGVAIGTSTPAATTTALTILGSSPQLVAVQDASSNNVFAVDTTAPDTNSGIDITQGGAQTANLLNFYSSSSALLAYFDANGNLVENSTAAFNNGATFSGATTTFNSSTVLSYISGTQCLHVVNGVVLGTGSDCGSGGGGASSTIINGEASPQFTFAAGSALTIATSAGPTLTYSFVNPGFVTAASSVNWTAAQTFNAVTQFGATSTFASSVILSALGTSGNNCLTVDATGRISTTTCSSVSATTINGIQSSTFNFLAAGAGLSVASSANPNNITYTFTNPGFVTAASSVTWSAAQTFTGGTAFNSTATFNSSTIFSFATSTLAFLNSSGQLGTSAIGTGLALIGNTLSNTGVTAAASGTGISVSNSTGSVIFTNTGVTSFNGGTGSVTGVGSISSGTFISASAATGSVTLNFINPGFVTAASSVTWSASQTFNATATFNSSTILAKTTSSLLSTNGSGVIGGASIGVGLSFGANSLTNTGVTSLTGSGCVTNGGNSTGSITLSVTCGTGTVTTSSAITSNNFPFWSGTNGALTGTSTLSVAFATSTQLLQNGAFNASGTITQNGTAVVLQTRQVNAGGILSGGGDLSADHTVSLSTSTLYSLFSGTSPIAFNTSTGGISFVNPGFVTAASSVAWSALQTFTGGTAFNSTATFNSSTIFSFATSTLAFLNSSGALGTTSISTGLNLSGNILTNVGVTSIASGTGIGFANSTGSITITNTGVTSFNGGTGSVTGVGSISSGTFISASAATGSVTLNFINPGFVTAASSVTWSAAQTFNNGATFNSTATFNSSTVFSVATNTLLSADANGKLQTTTFGGTGLSFANNTLTWTNPGFVTAASSVNWTALQTFTGGTAFNSTATFNSSTIFSFATSTLAFLNSSGQLGTSAIGTGLALIGNALSNTGVTTVASGTGISVSNSTGSVIFTNTGVTSFNGGTGSVTGVGLISSGTFISASAATGSVTLNFINPGFVTAASSVTWSASQTFTGGTAFNSTATFNSSTIFSFATSTLAFLNSSGQLGSSAIGTGLALIGNALSNTGVTAVASGTGISVSNSTGSVIFTNTGVTAAASGTGISVSNSTGSVIFTNTGVTSFNGGTGSVTGVGLISSGTFISASAATGSVTLNFINPGFVTAASSVTWSAAQTFNNGATFNSTATFNSSTVFTAGLTFSSTSTFNSSTIFANVTSSILSTGATGLVGAASIGSNLSFIGNTLAFVNPGFVTAASSVTWTGAQTFVHGATFNSTATFNSSTIFNAGVAIGTSTLAPNSLFTVGSSSDILTVLNDGSANIAGRLRISNAATNAATDTIEVNDNPSITANNAANSLSLSRSLTFAASSTLTGSVLNAADVLNIDTGIVTATSTATAFNFSRTASVDAGTLTVEGPLAAFTADDCSSVFAGGTCATSADVVQINQQDSSGVATGAALDITTAATAPGALALRVNHNGTFTDPNAFVVNDLGNVGIGTTTPTSALTVAGGAFIGATTTFAGNVSTTIANALVIANSKGILSAYTGSICAGGNVPNGISATGTFTGCFNPSAGATISFNANGTPYLTTSTIGFSSGVGIALATSTNGTYTFTNTGVTSFNGGTGSVTGVGSISSGTFISASAATGSVTLNFINPGFVTAASSVTWSASQTFNGGTAFNSTATFNSSTVFSVATNTLLSADANGKLQTTTFGGTGLSFANNTLTWTNPGYITSAPPTATIAAAGFTFTAPFTFTTSTGIGIASSSGAIQFQNTGVTSFNGGTGSVTGVGSISSGTFISASAATGSVTLNFINPGFVTAASSVTWSAAQTFTLGATFNGGLTTNATATFNSSTIVLGGLAVGTSTVNGAFNLFGGLNQAGGITSLASTTIAGNATTTKLSITALGSAGNPCLVIGATGAVSTSTCGGTATPAGSDTQIQFNSGNVLAANAYFTFTSSTDLLAISSSTGGLVIGTSTNATGSLLTVAAASTNALTVEDTTGNQVVTVDTSVQNTNSGIDITQGSGQTADLLNFYSSSSALLAYFDANGNLFEGGNLSASGTVIFGGLASSGNPCLTVGATGVVATSTCGGAGGGSVSTSSAITAGYLPYWATATGGLSGTSTLFFSTSSGSLVIGSTTAAANALFTVASSSNVLTILKNGNIGVGTSTPTSPFEVFGTPVQDATNSLAYLGYGYGNIKNGAASGTFLGINTSGVYNGSYLEFENNSSTVFEVASSGQLTIGTSTNLANTLLSIASSSPIFNIFSNGDVGIGATTTTSGLLTITGNNASSVIVQDTSGNSVFTIDSSQSGNNTGLDITAAATQGSNDLLDLYSSSSVKIAGFTSTGYLFVGTSSLLNTTTTLTVCARSNCTAGTGASTTNAVAFFASVDGTQTSMSIAARGQITGGLNDVGEFIPIVGSDTDYTAGDVVSITGQPGMAASGATQSDYAFQKASSSYDPKLAGVVTVTAGLIAGGGDDARSNTVISLAGRVPVKVSDMNGPIHVGDYLTASNIPGVAMLATQPGRVLGVALEAYAPASSTMGATSALEAAGLDASSTDASSSPASAQSTTTYVMMFVNPGYSLGSLTAEGDIASSSWASSTVPSFVASATFSGATSTSTTVLDQFTLYVKYALQKLGLAISNGIATVGQLFAQKVTTNELCVGTTCMDQAQLQQLLQGGGGQTVIINNNSGGGGGTDGNSTDATTTPASTSTLTSTSTSTAPSMAPANITTDSALGISFAAPAANKTVSGTVELDVNIALIASTTVSRVDFSVDGGVGSGGQSLGQGLWTNNPAYSFSWDTTGASSVNDGAHTVTAMVTDSTGATSTVTVALKIKNVAVPPPVVEATTTVATTTPEVASTTPTISTTVVTDASSTDATSTPPSQTDVLK